MTRATVDEVIESFPSTLKKLQKDLEMSPFFSSTAMQIGHIQLANGNRVEVQITLERDPKEWMDEDFAEDWMGE